MESLRTNPGTMVHRRLLETTSLDVSLTAFYRYVRARIPEGELKTLKSNLTA